MFGSRPNPAILAAMGAATLAAPNGHGLPGAPSPELADEQFPPDGTKFQVEYLPQGFFKFSARRPLMIVDDVIYVPAHYVKFAALALLQSEVAATIPGLSVAPVAAGSGPQLVPE